jgi:hypothetical protein
MNLNWLLRNFTKNKHLSTNIKDMPLNFNNKINTVELNDYFIDSIVYSIEQKNDAYYLKKNKIYLKKGLLLEIRKRISILFYNNCSIRLIYNKNDNDKVYSYFKVNTNNFSLDEVIEIINNNANSEFNLEQVDVTKDFVGSFNYMETREFLERKLNGFNFTNNYNAGRHCLVFLKDNLKLKLYMKHYSQLTNVSSRTNIGNLFFNYIKPTFEYQKSLFRNKTFNKHGCTRLEMTIYNKKDKTYWIDDLKKVFEYEKIIKKNQFYSFGMEKMMNHLFSYITIMNILYFKQEKMIYINYYFNSETRKNITLYFDLKKKALVKFFNSYFKTDDMYTYLHPYLFISLFGIPDIPVYLITIDSIKNNNYIIQKWIKKSSNIYFTKINNLLSYSDLEFENKGKYKFNTFKNKNDFKEILDNIYSNKDIIEVENDMFFNIVNQNDDEDEYDDEEEEDYEDDYTVREVLNKDIDKCFETSSLLYSKIGFFEIKALSVGLNCVRFAIKENDDLKHVYFNDNVIYEYILEKCDMCDYRKKICAEYNIFYDLNIKVHYDITKENKYFIFKEQPMLLPWTYDKLKKKSINELKNGYYKVESYLNHEFRGKNCYILKLKDRNTIYRSNEFFNSRLDLEQINQFYIYIDGKKNSKNKHLENKIDIFY